MTVVPFRPRSDARPPAASGMSKPGAFAPGASAPAAAPSPLAAFALGCADLGRTVCGMAAIGAARVRLAVEVAGAPLAPLAAVLAAVFVVAALATAAGLAAAPLAAAGLAVLAAAALGLSSVWGALERAMGAVRLSFEHARGCAAHIQDMAQRRIRAKWAQVEWMLAAAVFALFAPRMAHILDAAQDDGEAAAARRAA